MHGQKKALLLALSLGNSIFLTAHKTKNIVNKKTAQTKKSRTKKEKHFAPYHYRRSYHYGQQAPRDRLHWHENQQDLDAAFKLNTITQPEEHTYRNKKTIQKKQFRPTQHRRKNGPYKRKRRNKQIHDQLAIER